MTQIFVVEIPHQRAPTVWVANDESDFIARVAADNQRAGDTPDTNDFADWVEYLASDLSACHVFAGIDDAADGLADITGHGSSVAQTLLLDRLLLEIDLDTSRINELSDKDTPVYRHYAGQTSPQPAYLEMDEFGVLDADYTGEIGGGVPADVWNNVTLQWPIRADCSGGMISTFVAQDDVQRLLKRVHLGHKVTNHKGQLTPDAQDASDDLATRIDDDLNQMALDDPLWDASEWLWSGSSLRQQLHNQTLGQFIAEAEEAAIGTRIYGSIPDAIDREAKSMVENGDTGLTATHLAELVALDIITQEQADDYQRDL